MTDAERRRMEKYTKSEKGRATRARATARWKERNPDYMRVRQLAQYGLTPEDWGQLRAGGCGICGTHDDLVVDHDHETGKVRGALCRKHNAAIGLLSDSPVLVRAALAWLEK